jgi:hypothetical protein
MTICFPDEGVKAEQTYSAFMQFMRIYPERGNVLASSIATRALQASFPCKPQ